LPVAASSLSGKVALVTGAGSGIGEGLALALGTSGLRLGLVGRRISTLEAVSQRIGATSPEVKSYACDLVDESQLQRLGQRVQKDFGGLDILVHSAGIFSQNRLDSTSSADFDRQFRVNLLAPYSLTRLLLPSLQASQGQVVFINSSMARNGGRTGWGEYAATKAGLKAIADSFREEVNPLGIRVLSVYVGRTATPMQEAIFDQEGRDYQPERLLQPGDVAAVVLNSLTLPRTAEVTEIDIRPMSKV